MNILNEHFDNIYVLYVNVPKKINEDIEKVNTKMRRWVDDQKSISADITPPELRNIRPKIETRDIQVQYFEGINGKDYDSGYDVYNENYKKYSPTPLSPGSYGHLLSFRKIIRDAMMKKYKKILILESDIYFCENFFDNVAKYLELDYKLLYLGASQNMFYTEPTWEYIEERNPDMDNNGYYQAYKTLGTFAIAIDSSIFGECEEQFQKLECPTDVCLTKIQDKYRSQCYVTYPNLICCNIVKSSTSHVRNRRVQLEFMENNRWLREYDFNDIFLLRGIEGKEYDLVLEINSYIKNDDVPDYKVKINGKEMTNMKLTLNTKLDVEVDNDLNVVREDPVTFFHLVIPFVTESPAVVVHLTNLFVNRVELKAHERPKEVRKVIDVPRRIEETKKPLNVQKRIEQPKEIKKPLNVIPPRQPVNKPNVINTTQQKKVVMKTRGFKRTVSAK